MAGLAPGVPSSAPDAVIGAAAEEVPWESDDSGAPAPASSQSEESSEFPGMPAATIKTGKADFILPLMQIAPSLIELVMRDEN